MSSSSSSIIRLIILLSFDLSLILYLFALKRDRGEKRKREKKPFRIHLSAKNFETSPYLKLLIKITLLIIARFLISTNSSRGINNISLSKIISSPNNFTPVQRFIGLILSHETPLETKSLSISRPTPVK